MGLSANSTRLSIFMWVCGRDCVCVSECLGATVFVGMWV